MAQEIHYVTDMYQDSYYPTFLVDKVKTAIEEIVHFLETEAEPTLVEIQAKFDQMTIKINDLVEAFYEHDSEIETVARESIGATVAEILKAYQIDIDVETAIGERDW